MSIDAYMRQLHKKRRSLMACALRRGDRRAWWLAYRWIDWRLCCSPPNHWTYWCDEVCGKCEELEPWIA